MDNLFREKLAVLVEKNSDKYLEKFAKLDATGSKVSWNWCAFLFSFWWLAYRKMYLYAVGYYVAAAVVANIPYVGFVAIGFPIAMGILGNSIYFETLKKKINIADTMPEPEKSAYIKKNSGTSTVALVILIVISVLCIFAITALLALLGLAAYSM